MAVAMASYDTGHGIPLTPHQLMMIGYGLSAETCAVVCFFLLHIKHIASKCSIRAQPFNVFSVFVHTRLVVFSCRFLLLNFHHHHHRQMFFFVFVFHFFFSVVVCFSRELSA